MSLSTKDLYEIRNIVEDVVEVKIKPLLDEIAALRSDIKEIYDMIYDLQKTVITDNNFKKLSLEKKLLTLNSELLDAAKQAGITLPR